MYTGILSNGIESVISLQMSAFLGHSLDRCDEIRRFTTSPQLSLGRTTKRNSTRRYCSIYFVIVQRKPSLLSFHLFVRSNFEENYSTKIASKVLYRLYVSLWRCINLVLCERSIMYATHETRGSSPSNFIRPRLIFTFRCQEWFPSCFEIYSNKIMEKKNKKIHHRYGF